MADARDLDLPSGYTDLLGELQNKVRAARRARCTTASTMTRSGVPASPAADLHVVLPPYRPHSQPEMEFTW
jgi:hypothetical protein